MSLHKWNRTVRNLLGLAFFTQSNSLDLSPVICIGSSFLLLMRPWCGVDQSLPTFNIEGHVHLFQFGAIRNKTAMNTCMQVLV